MSFLDQSVSSWICFFWEAGELDFQGIWGGGRVGQIVKPLLAPRKIDGTNGAMAKDHDAPWTLFFSSRLVVE